MVADDYTCSKYDQCFGGGRRPLRPRNLRFPCSPKTLAKLACVSSNGPPFRKAGRVPLYPKSGLDDWAQSKIGPLVRSTSEVGVLPNPILENESPAARFLGGIDVHTGREKGCSPWIQIANG